jgi:Ribbon-helix-helix protein, copG family.
MSKPKRGRPALSEKSSTDRICFTLTNEEVEQFKDLAKRAGLSRSALFRMLVKTTLMEFGKLRDLNPLTVVN